MIKKKGKLLKIKGFWETDFLGDREKIKLCTILNEANFHEIKLNFSNYPSLLKWITEKKIFLYKNEYFFL